MEKKTVNVKELIEWHNKERRLHQHMAMSIGESLIKAKFHDDAVKLLQKVEQELTALKTEPNEGS